MDAFGSLAPVVDDAAPPARAPTQSDLYSHIWRNPAMRDALMQSILSRSNAAPSASQTGGFDPLMQDAAENAFGATHTLLPNEVRRMLGIDLTPQQIIQDDFLRARGATPLSSGRGNRLTPMGMLP